MAPGLLRAVSNILVIAGVGRRRGHPTLWLAAHMDVPVLDRAGEPLKGSPALMWKGKGGYFTFSLALPPGGTGGALPGHALIPALLNGSQDDQDVLFFIAHYSPVCKMLYTVLCRKGDMTRMNQV